MGTTTAKAPTGAGRSTGGSKRTAKKKWPYRFEVVPVESLLVDDRYQRPLTSFVDEVTRDYNPALIGTLIVSERDNGHLAVIDGQTRLEGMRRNGEEGAPCLVYHGLSHEQEAELFADLQTKRRGMATYLRFRASLVAKNTEAIAIAAIVQHAGFELDTTLTAHTVKAIAALESIYRRDPQLLSNVLDTIAQAWPDPDTEFRTSGDMIRGLAVFLTREQRVNPERLIEKLSAVTPRMIRHRANALKEGSGSGGGSPGYTADAILGIYMRGKGRGSSDAT